MLAWSGPIKRQNSGSRQQAAAVLGSTLRPSARAGAGPGPGRELRPDKTCAHLPATARHCLAAIGQWPGLVASP